MEDKLHQFFSENDFDFQEPNIGHIKRFEQKLNSSKKKTTTSWKWMSVAASVILMFGFYLGSSHQKKQVELSDISPKLEEVQSYFVSTINQELKTLENSRSLETETIIEEALNELEELEESYNFFLTDLNTNGYQEKLINEMIKNYQQRLEILENVMKQIKQIKNSNLLKNEIYI